jgi:hypothetical protein
MSMFGPSENGRINKPAFDDRILLNVLITVKAAPIPSEKYGETVCVAGLNLSFGGSGWLRLYPINFRYLDSDATFKKYDIVTLMAKPATEHRAESWRPFMETMKVQRHLNSAGNWKKRRGLIDPHIEHSMCRLNNDVRADPNSKSLALVRPLEVLDFKVSLKTGWSPEQQRKIDRYVNQPDLFDTVARTPLQAPRFSGTYRYRCHEQGCKTHSQELNDWELVALQRRLQAMDVSDEEIVDHLRDAFLTMMCAPKRDVAFYVGNQAARPQAFSVLGVYYPER